MFSKFFAVAVAVLLIGSVTVMAAQTFILFTNATSAEMVEKFQVSNRPTSITQEDLPYLAILLSRSELERVAFALQSASSIADTATLYDNKGINLSNNVINRVLVFYNLTENRK